MKCSTCGLETSNWLGVCDSCCVIDYLAGPYGTTIDWPVSPEFAFLLDDAVDVKIGVTEIEGEPHLRFKGLYFKVGRS